MTIQLQHFRREPPNLLNPIRRTIGANLAQMPSRVILNDPPISSLDFSINPLLFAPFRTGHEITSPRRMDEDSTLRGGEGTALCDPARVFDPSTFRSIVLSLYLFRARTRMTESAGTNRQLKRYAIESEPAILIRFSFFSTKSLCYRS